MPIGIYLRKSKTPTCHPNKKHCARGLCYSCYTKQYLKNNPETAYKKRQKARQWVKDNPEKVKTRRQVAFREFKDWLNNQKVKQGSCLDCKQFFPPYVMDFHHRDRAEKRFEISEGYGKSRMALLDEMQKCDLICANCHRIREHGQI